MPFADYIRRFADEFAFLQLDDCRLADRITFELDCNWKFVVENLFDVYHVMVIHRGSFGKFREAVDYFKDGRGEESLYGYYNSAALVPDGKSLFGNMPWLADKPATFACLGHLPPNLQLFGRCDAVVMDAIWPIAPDRTRLELHILFPKIHFAQPDFADKLKVYHDFQVRVIEEDRELVTSLQAGARSSKFRPGRLSQLEHGVYNEINHYLDRMLAEA
ncbi:MAG: RHO alpha subunit C-terminal catalytic domain-containing protein [Pseudomonadota bacterium]